MSLTIIYPLKLEWSEGGAKHVVEWNFYGGQREKIIKAFYEAVEELASDSARNSFESMRDLNPDLALTCPTCQCAKPKKNRKRKP